jgi:predicted PhzF superfamily epimerase YddE/YHI9
MSERRGHRYRVVDVFTESPLEGNPVAVGLPRPAELAPKVMQAIEAVMTL